MEGYEEVLHGGVELFFTVQKEYKLCCNNCEHSLYFYTMNDFIEHWVNIHRKAMTWFSSATSSKTLNDNCGLTTLVIKSDLKSFEVHCNVCRFRNVFNTIEDFISHYLEAHHGIVKRSTEIASEDVGAFPVENDESDGSWNSENVDGEIEEISTPQDDGDNIESNHQHNSQGTESSSFNLFWATSGMGSNNDINGTNLNNDADMGFINIENLDCFGQTAQEIIDTVTLENSSNNTVQDAVVLGQFESSKNCELIKHDSNGMQETVKQSENVKMGLIFYYHRSNSEEIIKTEAEELRRDNAAGILDPIDIDATGSSSSRVLSENYLTDMVEIISTGSLCDICDKCAVCEDCDEEITEDSTGNHVLCYGEKVDINQRFLVEKPQEIAMIFETGILQITAVDETRKEDVEILADEFLTEEPTTSSAIFRRNKGNELNDELSSNASTKKSITNARNSNLNLNLNSNSCSNTTESKRKRRSEDHENIEGQNSRPKKMAKRIGRKDPYNCQYCSKIFTRQINYLNHMKKSHPITNCNVCGIDFANTENMILHLSIHHINDTQCPICQEICNWYNLAHLKHHFQLLRCRRCEFFTNEKKILDAHEATCCQMICKICNIVFKDATIFRRHAFSQHKNGEPFECNRCGEKFQYLAGLRGHQGTCHHMEGK